MTANYTQLNRDSDEFKAIAKELQKSTDHRKKAMRFEPAYLNKAARKGGVGGLLKTLYSMVTTDQKEFGGDDEQVILHKVEKIDNQDLRTAYEQEVNTKVSTYSLNHHYNPDSWKTTFSLNTEKGEHMLFHGTSNSISNLISDTGFKPELCTYNKFSGYGSLGKGTYFTDEFSKNATFSSCDKCGQFRCSCQTEDGQPAPRIALLSRVVLGNAYKDTTKNRKYSKNIINGYDSSVGISKKLDPKSKFNSSEFIIGKGSRAYPQYKIYYTFNKNLLNLRGWKKESKISNFRHRRPRSLRRLDATISKIQKHQDKNSKEYKTLLEKAKEQAKDCKTDKKVSSKRYGALDKLIKKIDSINNKQAGLDYDNEVKNTPTSMR